MSITRRTYRDYNDYWDAYLKAHSKSGTRAAHYVATCLGLGFGLSGLFTLNALLMAIGIVGGYAIAIGSHRYIEHNRSLVHRPFWGVVSELRMFVLAVSGRLPAELSRHSVSPAASNVEYVISRVERWPSR